jgi:hypothetical protein
MTGLVAARLTLLCEFGHRPCFVGGLCECRIFCTRWRIRKILLQATRIIMEQSGALFDKNAAKRSVVP